MYKLSKKILVGGLSLLLLVTVLFMVPAKGYAVDVLSGPCSSGAGQSAVCQDDSAGGSNPIFGPSGILTVAVNILSILVGVFAVIFIIIQGIRMVASGGDSQTVASARNGVIYALVGLAVAVLAQALVAFVLNKVQ